MPEASTTYLTKKPVVTIIQDVPIWDAVWIMAQKGFRRLPVVDEDGQLVGIITATDLVRRLSSVSSADGVSEALDHRVADVMTRDVAYVGIDQRLLDAVRVMVDRQVGGVPVVNGEGRVRSIVTERDVVHVFTDKICGVRVSDLMTKEVVTAEPSMKIIDGLKLMVESGFRRLPIVEDGDLVGMATVMDVIRLLAANRSKPSRTVWEALTKDIMEIATPNVVTVRGDRDVGEAAELMMEFRIGALPVLNGGKLIGIITERDFFKLLKPIIHK